MDKLYLSQRNIATLLQKLDSVRDGQTSTCTIIKNDIAHPVYAQTIRRISVTAVESQNRYLKGVSPRLQLSRSTLLALLSHIDKPSDNGIEIDGMLVSAVPDEQFYTDHSAADSTPIGDLASSFFKNRGKQS